MALPPSFQNSFWTPDFKLDALWPKIRAGVVENQEILRLVQERAQASSATASALYDISETRLKSNGFGYGEGASLRRTFEGLKGESAQVAKAHNHVADSLDHMVLRPFTTWSHAHEGRVDTLIDQLDEAVKEWEGLSSEVRKLRDSRDHKCSLLDEAEENLRFAPTSPSATGSTSAVRSRSDSAASNSSYSGLRWDPHQAAQAAQQASSAASNLARTLTQKVKISPTAHAVKQRFERMRLEAKERELASRGQDPSSVLAKEELLDEEGNKVDTNEKRAIAQAVLQPAAEVKEPMKIQIDQLEIGGLVKHPKDWSIIFAKAKSQVPTTAVKVPLIGTTPDAHSGEDLVLWFRENLDELGGSLSRAHELCRQLSEELAVLRLVGEIGNKFFESSDAFYAWRPEAFHLDDVQHQISDSARKAASTDDQAGNLTEIPPPMKERRSPNSPLLSPKFKNGSSPSVSGNLESNISKHTTSPGTIGSPKNTSGLSRSNTISSYLTTAYEKAASNVPSLNSVVAKVTAPSGSERFTKLKQEAQEAEEDYRVAVRDLEDTRLRLEELYSATLARAQKLETDRLKAVKNVLTTYNASLASLNTPLQLSSERSALLSEAFQPLSDVNSIIEQYRTGSFRPKPNVWTDFYHETTDVRFGVDLRHWADMESENPDKAARRQMPDIFSELLQALKEGYPALKTDEERRKTWVYEVPLPYTHRLRNLLNSSAEPLPAEDLRRFDLPVIASCIKLYLLELAVSLIPSALYSDVKAIYPSVGADSVNQEARIESLLSLLERVPKIHLVVLDALLSHLKDLIASTEGVAESAPEQNDQAAGASDADYIAKLGATLGPCILRPTSENSKTLNDRFPAQLFNDLLKDYSRLLPPTLEKKVKVEEERYAPKRQRTKMVDQRVTRSTTALKDNKRHSDWLKDELEKKMGHKIMEEPEDVSVPEKALEVEPTKQDMPTLPSKESASAPLAQAEAAVNQGSEMEEPQIPPVPEIVRPTSSSSESEGGPADKSAGFVTPTEELADVSQNAKTAMSPSSEPLSTELSNLAEGSLATTDAQPAEDDKPLVASASIVRSSTGSSSARRNPLSRSGATRGPRPMSMHGPPSSAGGSTGSPSSAAGVRARAAMFEQKGSPSPK